MQLANARTHQACLQDFAAGGGQKPQGGHIFQMQYWMYAATTSKHFFRCSCEALHSSNYFCAFTILGSKTFPMLALDVISD